MVVIIETNNSLSNIGRTKLLQIGKQRKRTGQQKSQGYWMKLFGGMSCTNRYKNQQLFIYLPSDTIVVANSRAVLCFKNIEKGFTADNYMPITWLLHMQKLFTGRVAESMDEGLGKRSPAV